MLLNHNCKYKWTQLSNQKVQVVCLPQKGKPINLLIVRSISHKQTHTQTKNERIENYIPCIQKSKVSRSSDSHVTQSRFQSKINQEIKEDHYILIKTTFLLQQESITILNMYDLNMIVPKFIKYTLLSRKEQICSAIKRIRNLSTPFSSGERTLRQKLMKIAYNYIMPWTKQF